MRSDCSRMKLLFVKTPSGKPDNNLVFRPIVPVAQYVINIRGVVAMLRLNASMRQRWVGGIELELFRTF